MSKTQFFKAVLAAVLAIGMIAVFTSSTFADSAFWTGAIDQDWNKTGNWETSNGSATAPASVPTVGQTATFDDTTGNGYPVTNIPAGVNVTATTNGAAANLIALPLMTIDTLLVDANESGVDVTLTFTGNVTVTTGTTVRSTASDANAGLALGGNSLLGGGNVTVTTSSDAEANLTNAGAMTVGDLTVSVTGTATANATATQASGAFNASGAVTVTSTGAATGIPTLNVSSGSGFSAASLTITSSAGPFAAPTLNVGANDVAVTGNVTITDTGISPVFTTASSFITIGGDLSISASGGFTLNTASTSTTYTFNGTSSQNIDLKDVDLTGDSVVIANSGGAICSFGDSSGPLTIPVDLTVNAGAIGQVVNNPLTVTNDTLLNGKLTTAANDITFTDNSASGVIIGANGELEATGAATITLSQGVLNNSAGGVLDLAATSTLSLGAGATITTGSGGTTLGTVSDNGNTQAYQGTGTVTFLQTFAPSATPTLDPGVNVVSSGGFSTVNVPITVKGSMTADANQTGTLGSSNALTVEGLFTISGATVNLATSGPGEQVLRLKGGLSISSDLVSTVGGDVTIEIGAGTTSTIGDTLTLAGAAGNRLLLASDTLGSSFNLVNNGTLDFDWVAVRDCNLTNNGTISITAYDSSVVNATGNTGWPTGVFSTPVSSSAAAITSFTTTAISNVTSGNDTQTYDFYSSTDGTAQTSAAVGSAAQTQFGTGVAGSATSTWDGSDSPTLLASPAGAYFAYLVPATAQSDVGLYVTISDFTISVQDPPDHFVIDPIASPQLSGVSFNITITAQDASNSTVTAFSAPEPTATVTLSEPTGTISPTISSNFINGVLTETVTIAGGGLGLAITATSGSATGLSNTFDVYLNVSNANDSGAGSLRQAITDANSIGADTIIFTVSGGTTISPTLALPALTDNGTIIDASSLFGVPTAGQPGITLDGTSAGSTVNGLAINADNCEIRGLYIRNFEGDGVQITGSTNIIGGETAGYQNVISGNVLDGVGITGNSADNNTVLGNYIGVAPDGETAEGNGGDGVRIENGAGANGSPNTIGGTTAAARNIISGNTGKDGVAIDGVGTDYNVVIGNYIGTDKDGDTAIGNQDDGVFITNGAQNNTVGGTAAGARNVIFGNGFNGVVIDGADNNTVLGNFIGVAADGVMGPGNSAHGVVIRNGAQNNTIGGAAAGAGNVISGNSSNGLQIQDSNTDNNTVLGNIIGLTADGETALGNSSAGIRIEGGAGASGARNTIGGTTAAERNIISENGLSGVFITGSGTDFNLVQGNYIGTDKDGDTDRGNSLGGVIIDSGAQNNTIGGTNVGEGNVISGNDGSGVSISGVNTDNNKVLGNIIGLTADGETALGNSGIGVFIQGGAGASGAPNTIGGTTAGARNVISGNPSHGVAIDGSGTDFSVVSGNYIGTDKDGDTDLGNTFEGVIISSGAQNNTIGGTTVGAGNVISGNRKGVEILGANTDNNTVQGNIIGLAADGVTALGNSQNGVFIRSDAQFNTIGGTNSGEANTIAHNGDDGVEVDGASTTLNTISRNSIHDNTALGIELVNGGNGEITAPTITTADLSGNTLTVAGSAGVTTGALTEIFVADSASSGEGKTFLGELTVDGSGNFGPSGIDVTGQGLTGAESLVATVTHDNGNTSEFGSASDVNALPQLATNTGLTVNQGATGSLITNSELLATDTDNTATELIYTVVTATIRGTLKKSGTALTAGSTFTQDDIDTNKITYDHTGGDPTDDSFVFTFSDGVFTSGNQTFTITVGSGDVTWDGGGDGSSWDDALNWDTDTLPGASDDAVIDDPGSITVIHSTGTTSINSLICKENLTFSGDSLTIADASTIDGTLTISGDPLTVNGQSLTVGGDLTVSHGNTPDGLIMTNTSDSVTVNGNATFQTVDGASAGTSAGNYTAGILRVRGSFTQLAGAQSATGLAFVSTGTKVVLDGTSAQTVNFLNPGATLSRFQDIDILNTTGVTFTSTVHVTGQLTLGTGGVLNQAGGLNLFYANIPPINAAGTYNVINTRVAGALTMTAPLTLADPTSDLFIDAGTSLTINGQNLSVGGDLTVGHGNTLDGLIMTNASDSVTVNGNATFQTVSGASAGTSAGNYTAGILRVRGNFTQLAGAQSATGLAFVSTGTKVVFDGTSAQTVSFTTPGTALSRFQDVDINNTVGGVTLTSDVVVTGQFTNNGVGQISSGTTLTVSGGAENTAGSNLQGAGTLEVSGTTFTNRGDVNPGTSPGVLSITGDYVQDSTGALNIEIGGLVAGTDFDQLDISGTATLAGTLNVSLISAFNPSQGNSFQIVNYASNSGTFDSTNLPSGFVWDITYGASAVTITVISTLITWDGGGDGSSWSDPLNWDTDTLPGASDDAVIDDPGSITVIHSTGTTAINSLTCKENLTFSGGSLTIAAASTIDGSLTISGGPLTVNGQSLTIGGDLAVTVTNISGDGLIMTNPADTVIVAGNASFEAAGSVASGVGNFSAGLLRVGGNFTETRVGASGTTAFASTGTKVVFDGTGAQTVSFQDPGASSSRFQDVDIDNSAGVTFTSTVYVTGQLTLGAGGVLNQTSGLTLFYTSQLPDIAAGTYNVVNTRVAGTLTMTAPLTLPQATNDLFIIDAGAKLTINGQSLTVGGNLAVTISNTPGDGLFMTNPADTVTVTGNASFEAAGSVASGVGNFSAGLLRVGGNFTETRVGASGTTAFASTGTKVVFDGTAAQTVSFQDPGASSSRFQDVQIDNTVRGVTLTSNVVATGAFTNNGGLEILSGNTVTSSGTFDNAAAGTLQGEGTLDVSAATFTNAGNVNPGTSPGILSITGNYTQDSTGTLNIEIGGLTAGSQFDRLAVSGSATLAGTLNVSLINPFNPSQGNSFQIVNYASNSGTFDSTNLPSGFVWDITYGANAVTITVISTLITWDGGGDGSSWDDPLNWDTDTLPGASDDAIIDDPGSITVTHSTGTTSINSLTCKENLTFSGGSFTIAGASTIDGSLTISGGPLTVNGQSLTVGGDLTVTISDAAGDGLIMTNAADSMTVAGNVTFTQVFNDSFATSTGNFTAGVLKVRGNFTQTTPGGPTTSKVFVSTGTKVVFDGTTAQTVSFTTPGVTFSRFQDVDIDNAAGLTFSSSAVANGTVTILNGTVTSTAGTVTIGGDLVDAVGGRWQVMDTTFSGAAPSLPATLTTNATFSGGGVISNGFTLTGNLSVAAGGKLVMNDQTVMASGSLTVTISDAAGDGLIMTNAADSMTVAGNVTFTQVFNDSFATSTGNFTAGVLKVRGNFTQTTPGGPTTSKIFVSTGTKVVFDGTAAQTVNFTTPGVTFSRFQDVDIDNAAGLTFSSSAVANGTVTILNGTVTSTAGTVTIGGDLVDAVGGRWQVMDTTFSGAAPSLPAILTTNATFSGGGVIPNGFTLTGNLSVAAGGKLVMNGQTVTASGSLTVTISDTGGDGLIMTNAADSMTVAGNVTFTQVFNDSFATSAGNFTAGVLKVRGNFTQTTGGATTSKMFVLTGTKVVFDGTAAQTVSFTTPGVTLSQGNRILIKSILRK